MTQTTAAAAQPPSLVAEGGQDGRSPAVGRDPRAGGADESPGASDSVPWLVPILGFGQELTVRLLVLLWALTAAWFWLWWSSPARGAVNAGRIAATGILVWLFMNAAYGLFFICRMTRPNPALAVPDVRVAMVVTKVPAEPWPVLQQTLEAMLDQDFPHPYDVWLADELPSRETLSWCAENRVAVSTRHGVAEYQRPVWPRRTKTKEGNLAYFYDTVGYDRYDVVAQLDSDHVPASGYLTAIVRPFADARIGYVSAPSICDANLSAGWTVRGRLYKEAALHGPVQAGCNAGWAPVCIGSHYAVRTVALQEVGGLGPELAEDYSTTLWLQSAGWDGVFAIDAEAHGDGPETLAAMLVQEMQWSRSLGLIFTRWAPKRFRTTPLRARIRLGFALTHYLAQAIFFAVGVALPCIAVVLHMGWGSNSLIGFYSHLWPSSLVLLVLTWLLRRQGVLRPRSAKLWSLDLLLFQIVRWPWTAWAFVYGMWLGIRARDPGFAVTPKGPQAQAGVSARLLVPTLALGILPASVVLAIQDPGLRWACRSCARFRRSSISLRSSS
ncbi:MAG: glycosyltransferase [Acidimicrobiales bacterium]